MLHVLSSTGVSWSLCVCVRGGPGVVESWVTGRHGKRMNGRPGQCSFPDDVRHGRDTAYLAGAW